MWAYGGYSPSNHHGWVLHLQNLFILQIWHLYPLTTVPHLLHSRPLVISIRVSIAYLFLRVQLFWILKKKREIIQYLFWLNSVSIMYPRFIHIVTDDKTSCFIFKESSVGGHLDGSTSYKYMNCYEHRCRHFSLRHDCNFLWLCAQKWDYWTM